MRIVATRMQFQFQDQYIACQGHTYHLGYVDSVHKFDLRIVGKLWT